MLFYKRPSLSLPSIQNSLSFIKEYFYLEQGMVSVPPGKDRDPKPFTTPPGWKPPTLGECWHYFYRKHPYYRYGYSAVVLLGLIGWYSGGATSKEEIPHGHDNVKQE